MKDVMSIKELSEYLGIGKSKIYQLIKLGKIPASKIGRQYKFSKEVVDQWLKEKIVIKKDGQEKTLFNTGPEKKENETKAPEIKTEEKNDKKEEDLKK